MINRTSKTVSILIGSILLTSGVGVATEGWAGPYTIKRIEPRIKMNGSFYAFDIKIDVNIEGTCGSTNALTVRESWDTPGSVQAMESIKSMMSVAMTALSTGKKLRLYRDSNFPGSCLINSIAICDDDLVCPD